jgi:hypothetical protein
LRLKITGALHLTNYLVHPLLLLALILSIMMRFQQSELFLWTPVLMIPALISPLLYLSGPAPDAPDWKHRLKLIPGLILLSIGISLNNAQAALKGLFFSSEGNFVRTPKFAVNKSSDRWERSHYVLRNNPWEIGELTLMLLSFLGLLHALINQDFFIIPWLLFYGAGYGMIALISIKQSIRYYLIR